ncbi:aminopeptidase P family protein [Verrucomicrobiaceae bacterium R5-34]|uniref:Aminopeptidase P family protein n=1 Tax=Oceaniferula flava TaxID=2800421 RepID=A0AAE2SBM9_9BACT|nr:Xaa-Pro peptidase family protein [Oceaniferula flavus]MBK1832248.1 aminopeptidase P family protein [Verrucomicrobiaceae bacterium R5-34]MBK1854888.1 aminopeptidase P family protein [Oceaniferula flavus]MBM1136194.1 aminopeptidase P family protein [Oceaniferula flavus]
MSAIQANSQKTSRRKPKSSILFHADANDPDMLYFSRFNAFDPYIALTLGRKKVGISHAMEYGRMEKESDFDEILLLSEVQAGARKRFNLEQGQAANTSQMVAHLAKEYGIDEFKVGDRFPTGLAFALRDAGIQVSPCKPGTLFPERIIKNNDEIKLMKKANEAACAGFQIVAKTLAESKVKKGQLIHSGRVLTAERIRELIGQATLGKGAVALHTIASPGDQAVDNHCAGYGPIREGELIVVDIFPRRQEDGYWGDMTRTFLKGKASDAQRRLVRTVKKAHQMSLDMIKPGATGSKVHRDVQAFFVKEGYETTTDTSQPEGFFHALGHGVGLEIHESPIIAPRGKWRFKKGMVVTTEPGLYYYGLGGCRIEDSLQVTADGNQKLAKAPYKWEIA